MLIIVILKILIFFLPFIFYDPLQELRLSIWRIIVVVVFLLNSFLRSVELVRFLGT